jgi:heat shock protein HslJ
MSLLALLGLLSSACVPITPVPSGAPAAADPTVAPAEAGTPPPLEGRTWQLRTYVDQSGATAEPVAEATLSFRDGRVGGSAGCNTFSATYTLDGQQLTIGQAMSTMMACPEPAMAQELAVLTLLSQTASYTLDAGKLQLRRAEGQPLLVFVEQIPAALTGVLWQATRYNNGTGGAVSLLAGTQLTATFNEDGTLTGSAGCNNYNARYTAEGEQITIGPGATTRKLCNEPAGLMEQERAYLAALTTAATYMIQGDQLELRTADGALVASYTTSE